MQGLMKKYVVRYERIYSATVWANSEEEAIAKLTDNDFETDDKSEYEATEES
jgi:hypothetical protein